MHKVPFFAATGTRAVAPAAPTASVRAADALLVPLIVMLAFTLLSGAFSAGFDWLYPLKVVGTGAALWVFWRAYDFRAYSASLVPVAAGVAVFFMWMLLVPLPAERTAEMASALAGAPVWLAAGWLLFRCLGSAVVVPLAEELAFRGYLLRRLTGDDATLAGSVRFTWISFLLSSVLFGLFHGAWLAGTIAGLAYALVRYYRGALGDAVVAHMTTNLLLSGYVLITGQWGYW
jgi:CAAX prenyl protease-like protein